LQNINEISAFLDQEVEHYRLVAKKYKRAKKIVEWGAAVSSLAWAAFSGVSFGSALSIIGLPATIPLGGLAGGVVSPYCVTVMRTRSRSSE